MPGWGRHSNGQAEASNKILLTTLKKHLHLTKGKWVEELPEVLWAYITTNRKPTEVSLFALTYGMEAIIPTEASMPTLRTEFPEEANTEALGKDLDMTNELRKAAAVRITLYQRKLTSLYKKHVKSHALRVRDLVLRKVIENTANPAANKFQPNWERPYMIVRVGPTGSYALDKLDRTPMPRMWNAMHLNRYYQ